MKNYKTTRTFIITMLLLSLGIATFSGCQVPTTTKKETGDTTVKEETVKEPKDYLPELKELGLDVNEEEAIDVATLPKEVKALSGVSFKGDNDAAMKLLLFENQEAADTARDYYINLEQETFTDENLLFVSDRTMADGWFDKYKDNIFKQ
ncbi:MAG TPA: hypothetical protein H9887_08360 [Candidatus Dorea intestinavium]|nr:hypothetical protein [Candidatus Dorea intestinavium]